MIRLEKFEKTDFNQLISWINSEILLKNWAGDLFRFPLTEESLDWYIEDTNEPGVSDAFVYKAVDTISGEVVGHISLGGMSYKNRSGRISRVFVDSFNHGGKGICQQMIRAVLKIGFAELNLHRVSLGVYDDNISAIKCYEKSGFKIEGIGRDIMWYNEKWRSMIEMGMLENEWRELVGGVDKVDSVDVVDKVNKVG
ncbi:MAG: GNAT family protein [Ferruginibacter sp.]